MNPYATHLPLLVACLENTEGPILELGSGLYSTPIINAFSHGRFARTIEADPNWFSMVSNVCLANSKYNQSHQIMFAPNYDLAPIDDHEWGVALIDNEPPARRGDDLRRLKGKAKCIIAHDTEHEAYRYRPLIDEFKFSFTDSSRTPWTTIVSDSIPLNWLNIDG